MRVGATPRSFAASSVRADNRGGPQQASFAIRILAFLTPSGQHQWLWGFVMLLAWSRLLSRDDRRGRLGNISSTSGSLKPRPSSTVGRA